MCIMIQHNLEITCCLIFSNFNHLTIGHLYWKVILGSTSHVYVWLQISIYTYKALYIHENANIILYTFTVVKKYKWNAIPSNGRVKIYASLMPQKPSLQLSPPEMDTISAVPCITHSQFRDSRTYLLVRFSSLSQSITLRRSSNACLSKFTFPCMSRCQEIWLEDVP